MLSTALPPLPQTPGAAPAAPPAHGKGASQAADKGPDSFSRLLDKAGDTQREADAASAPDEARASARATPGKGKPTRTDTRPGPGNTTATPARDTLPQDVPADTGAVAPATEDALGTDAAALLASLAGLAPPPGTPAAASAQATARQALRSEGEAAGGSRAAAAESTTAALSTLSGTTASGAKPAADKAQPDKSAVAAADTAFTRQWNAAVGTEAGRSAAADAAQTASPAAAPRFEAPAPGALPQALASTTAAPTGPAPAAQATLAAPPGSPDFAHQLGAQLSTFVREGVQHARLELHPTELGPVTVQIQLDGANAQLSFAAEHAQTRQALEQAMPTLAGSLREAGLTLSGGGVFERPPQPQPDSGQAAEHGRHGAIEGIAAGPAEPAAGPSATPRRRGVVDLVA